MFIGSNVYAPRMALAGEPLQFAGLLAEASMVGRDLAVTNVRTGARKSIFSSVSAEVAENVADEYVVNGLYLYGAMNGATNLVDTDITAVWAQDGGITRSEPESNVHRIAYAGTGDNRNVYYSIGTASADRITKCQIRLVSGTPSASHSMGFWEASLEGTTFPLDSLTTDWQDAVCSVTSATQTSYMLFNFNSAGGAITIEVRYIRTVASTVAHPAFPNGSAAAAAYGTDVPSCTPSWTSAGTLVMFGHGYGWFDPSTLSAFARTYDVTSAGTTLAFRIGTDWEMKTWDGVTTVKKWPMNVFLEDTFSIFSHDWSGSSVAVRMNTETKVSTVSSSVPSGSLYLGVASDGSQIFHGPVGILIYERVLSDAEYEVVRAGIASRLSGVTFR